MNRLHEFQSVALSLPDGVARGVDLRAYVIAVDGRTADLQPVDRGDSSWLPDAVAGVLMTFRHGLQTVALKGELRREAEADSLRFRVTDDVYVPRVRSSRLKLCAPAVLTPLDDGGRRAGEAMACQTFELGVDGLLLEPRPGLRPGRLMQVELMLPGGSEPLSARAMVDESGPGELPSLEWVGLERNLRRGLRQFVSDELRKRLQMMQAAQASDDDWD
jgi:hypothetical protein